MRRFVLARARGDAAGARDAWTALMEQEHDRIVALVRIWGAKGRLSADEREEACSAALLRAWNGLQHNFRGTTMGELVNALKRCVELAGIDVQRAAATHRGRHTSLDARLDEAADAEGHGGIDGELADVLADDHRRALERHDAGDFLAWALGRLPDPRQAVALQHSVDGVPAAETAAELGVTIGNLYQLRRRGLKAIGKLKEQWDA